MGILAPLMEFMNIKSKEKELKSSPSNLKNKNVNYGIENSFWFDDELGQVSCEYYNNHAYFITEYLSYDDSNGVFYWAYTNKYQYKIDSLKLIQKVYKLSKLLEDTEIGNIVIKIYE